jgi:hypothetical protein
LLLFSFINPVNYTFGTIFDLISSTIKSIKMKISTFIAATMILSISLFCSQGVAQSSGIAADKQKQANLEKNKAHQKEMQKKYNSLSPEEKKQAEARANEYKKSGGKKPAATTSSPKPSASPASKTAPAAAAKPQSPAAGSTKTVLKGKPVPAGTKTTPPAPTKTGTSKTAVKTPAATKPAPAEKAPGAEKK